MNHDQRVLEIQEEIEKSGKGMGTHKDWMDHFKTKGYLEDEFDLAYALSKTKVRLSPFVSGWVPFFAFFVLAVLLGAVLWIRNGNVFFQGMEKGEVAFTLIIFVVPIAIYLVSMAIRFKNQCWLVLRSDLGAKVEAGTDELMRLWKASGVEFLGRQSIEIQQLSRLNYKGHNTYFGNYVFWQNEGRESCFFIVQQAHRSLPHARCIKPLDDWSFLRSKVKLDGAGLNAQYSVYAKGPLEARQVFIPQVVSALLDPKTRHAIKSFEVAQDWIVLVFEGVVGGGIRWLGPGIRFGNYQKIKQNLLAHLDLASGLNDLLSH